MTAPAVDLALVCAHPRAYAVEHCEACGHSVGAHSRARELCQWCECAGYQPCRELAARVQETAAPAYREPKPTGSRFPRTDGRRSVEPNVAAGAISFAGIAACGSCDAVTAILNASTSTFGSTLRAKGWRAGRRDGVWLCPDCSGASS